jgi:hypothetical protein
MNLANVKPSALFFVVTLEKCKESLTLAHIGLESTPRECDRIRSRRLHVARRQYLQAVESRPVLPDDHLRSIDDAVCIRLWKF